VGQRWDGLLLLFHSEGENAASRFDCCKDVSSIADPPMVILLEVVPPAELKL
jgi:hypothetical protein